MVISLLLICVVMFAVSTSFAADENITLGEVGDEIAIEDVLSVEEDTDALSVDDESSEVVSASATVTNSTFHNYFDDSGTLLDTVTAEELEFEGDFTGIDVNYISIDKSIKLTGKNAIFNGVSFVISSDDVVIDGFNLKGSDYALIAISEVSDVTISNCIINFNAIKDSDSFAIYAFNVENLKIIGNTFTYVGNTTGTNINNVIRILGDEENDECCDGIVIQKNTFDISIPSVTVKHPDMYTLKNTEIFSSGIELIYCSDVKILDNNMNIKYNNVSGRDDTIYGIVVRGNPMSMTGIIISDDILIENNTINAKGYKYIYAIYVAGDDFEVSNNKLNVSADNYYANGIQVEGPSDGGLVYNNTIVLKAPGATYGIIGGMYKMGLIEDIRYVANNISTDSYLSCGFELDQYSSKIINNTIIANGNYTVGICDTVKDESTIYNNEIKCLGSNIGTNYTGDGILGKESIGITVLGDVLIKENKVYSTDIGVKANEEGTISLNNNTIVVIANSGKVNNYAIVAEDIDDLTIINNKVGFSGLVDDQFEIIGYYDPDTKYYPIYDTTNNTNSYGVYIKKSDVTIKNNTFEIAIPTFAVNWGLTRESFSEGIVLVGCDDLVFENNNVTIQANGGSSWDTIYGIDVLNSARSHIQNNNITLIGKGYSYGIIINDELFLIADNRIAVTSDNYACGIDVEGAAKGAIDENMISVEATESAYAIYTGMTSGDVDVIIVNNVVEAKAYYVVALEIAANSTLIENNTIYAQGNHTIGVGTKVSKVTIRDNVINAFASNEGNNSVWDGMGTLNSGIKVIEGNATIFNNTIASNAIGINVDSTNDNVTIEKNDIVVNANSGKVDNFAIVADDIDDLSIIDNNVMFNGLVDNQFAIVGYDTWGYPIYDTTNNTYCYAVFIINSNVVIKNNTFEIAIPTFAVNWGLTRESFSEGIVLVGCDDLEFIGNNVTITANGGTSWDTIYGIDVLNSADPTIENNNITLNGKGYSYCIIINDETFDISENYIVVTSDNYACGIDVEGKATGSIVDNEIYVSATESAYPIYTGMTSGEVNVDIYDNYIEGKAYYVVGLEIAANETEILDNIIIVEGNHTIGIGVKVNEAIIEYNNVLSKASNIGDKPVWDNMGTDTTGIKVVDGNFSIYDNTVITTGDYAINSGDNDGSIVDNDLLSNNGAGDDAIIGLGNVTSIGNDATLNPYLKVIIISNDLTKVEGSSDKFVVKILDENSHPVGNKTIKFVVNNTVYTATSDLEGVATFDANFTAGEYIVTTIFNDDSLVYGFKSVSNKIVVSAKPVPPTPVTKEATKIAAKKKTFKAKKKTKKYTATLKDSKGKAISKAKLTLKIKNKKYTAKTNAKGIATFKIKKLNKKGSYKGKITFAGNDLYKASSKSVKIKVKK